MQLISINIGKKETLQNGRQSEDTGIYKLPILHEAVQVTSLGIIEDFIGNAKHHGGPDQAIYVYGLKDYAWWSTELGHAIEAGTFGENLTVSELESAKFNIGDYLHINAVTLQVTAPRIPCGTFAKRMDDPKFVKRFRSAERPGLYCRVISEGTIKAGDDVRMEEYAGETIPLIQMYRDYYVKDKSRESLQRHLAAPISIRARLDLEAELHKL